MLSVVVLLSLVPIVGLSLLMLPLMLVLQAGPMVLLYYSSYYINRGGLSGYGLNCGFLFANATSAASYAAWYIGAVL